MTRAKSQWLASLALAVVITAVVAVMLMFTGSRRSDPPSYPPRVDRPAPVPAPEPVITAEQPVIPEPAVPSPPAPIVQVSAPASRDAQFGSPEFGPPILLDGGPPGLVDPDPDAERAWLRPDAPVRIRVYVPFLPVPTAQDDSANLPPVLQPEPSTARVRIPAGLLPAGVDMRSLVVLTENGGAVTQFPITDWGRGEADVFFERAGDERHYHFYFGGPAAPPALREKRSAGLELLTYNADVRRLSWIDATGAARRFTSSLSGAVAHASAPMRVDAVNHTTNPFGPTSHYISVFQGWLQTVEPGVWAFGTDSDDGSVLLVDGRPAISWRPGNAHVMATEDFSRYDGAQYGVPRPSLRLDPGVHRFTYYHYQESGECAARAGWRPPGAERIELIPKWAFMTYLDAHPVRIERLVDGRAVPLPAFDYSVLRKYRTAGDVALVELALTAQGAGPYRWSVGSGPAAETASRTVRIIVPDRARKGDAESSLRPVVALASAEGASSRTVHLGARAEEMELDVEMAAAGAPNIVYEGDRAASHVEIRSSTFLPVHMELRVRRALSGAPETSDPPRRFTLAPERVRPERIDLVAAEPDAAAPGAGARAAGRIDAALCLQGWPRPVAKVSFRVAASRGDLPAFKAIGDHLETVPDGERLLLVTPREDEAFYRKWAGMDAARRRLNAPPPRALFFGDSLVNPGRDPADDEGVCRTLKAALAAVPQSVLRRAPWAESPRPILGALAAVDRALAAETVSENTVILCLGLADARADTPPLDFSRGIDVLIDRVRRWSEGARIIVIGPPPEVDRSLRSRVYNDLAKASAAEHHAEFVDLCSLIESQSKWEDLYADSAGDAAHFTYPVGRGREMVEKALSEALLRK
jgi:hypothetical protein